MNEPAWTRAMSSRLTDLVALPGGRFRMGSDRHYPEEAPVRDVELRAFAIERHPVTNAQFAAFVAETSHVTTAEQTPDPALYPGADPALLVPGSVVFTPPNHPVSLHDPSSWWSWTPGADWRHPWGPASSVEGLDDLPVVHVSYVDASAFATWCGRALPTEAQYEYAARGGLDGCDYPWGDERDPRAANHWMGRFPHDYRRPDRPAPGPAPVATFPPNGYGLYDMVGNVWHWTQDRWGTGGTSGPCCAPTIDPVGPADAVFDPDAPSVEQRVLKGGSFLCADEYCHRYRPAARIPESVDTGTCHVGFRCVSASPPAMRVTP